MLCLILIDFLMHGFVECRSGVLHILKQLLHLHQLCLDRIVSPNTLFTCAPRNTRECISLPHLEKLALAGPISWEVGLLTQLELPKSTIVNLECYYQDPRFISMLLSLIPDQIGNYPPVVKSAQTTIQYLDLDYVDHSDGWIFTYGPTSTTDTSSVNMPRLYRKGPGSQVRILEGQMGDISAWFFAFPVAELNVIAVHGDVDGYFDHEDPWTDTFWNASELHTINVDYGHIGNLIWALHPHDGVIPVPNLIDITLGQI